MQREYEPATVSGSDPSARSWAVIAHDLIAALRVLYWRTDMGRARLGSDEEFAAIIRRVRSVAPMSDPAPVAWTLKVQALVEALQAFRDDGAAGRRPSTGRR